MLRTEAPRPLDDDRLLTIQEVSAILRVTPWTVYDLIRESRLSAIRIGKRAQRVRESAVRAYLNANQIG